MESSWSACTRFQSLNGYLAWAMALATVGVGLVCAGVGAGAWWLTQ